jgi:enterochelin esterase-like enzyme
MNWTGGQAWAPPQPGPHLPTVLPSDVVTRLQSQGLLLTPWPAVVVALVASAVAVVTALRFRRRRRQHRRAWTGLLTGALTTSLAVTLAAAAGLNAYVGYAPSIVAVGQLAGVTPLAQPAYAHAPIGHGRLIPVLLGDRRLKVPPGRTYVYLPPGYSTHPQQRYPVVYLIHGSPGGSQDWMRAGQVPVTVDLLVSRHVIPPMIVVAPDVNAGWLRDSECLDAVGGAQVATYLVRDVVGWADRHLRTLPDRGHRVLGGMSMGGFCALDVGLHHQELFGTLLAFQPYGDPGRDAARALLAGRQRLVAAHTPSQYAAWIPVPQPLSVYLDTGNASSGAVRRVQRLAGLFARRGIPTQFRIQRGQGHTWGEARAGLPWGLLFAARHLAAS